MTAPATGSPATAEPGTTEPTAPQAPTPAADPATGDANGDLGDAGKEALRKEREARKAADKELRELRTKVQQFEDAKLTDEQRNTARIEALEKDAAKAIRYEAADQAGLPLRLAPRLVGSTLDELLADAQQLKAEMGESTPAAPPAPSTPKPDPRQGGGQTDAGGSMAAGKALYASRKPAHK
ncbi:hypothetical protein [Nocardia sp. NPDC003963]